MAKKEIKEVKENKNSKYIGKIVYVQGIMHEAKLAALKEKTGETNAKDAIAKAVDAYLEVKQ